MMLRLCVGPLGSVPTPRPPRCSFPIRRDRDFHSLLSSGPFLVAAWALAAAICLHSPALAQPTLLDEEGLPGTNRHPTIDPDRRPLHHITQPRTHIRPQQLSPEQLAQRLAAATLTVRAVIHPPKSADPRVQPPQRQPEQNFPLSQHQPPQKQEPSQRQKPPPKQDPSQKTQTDLPLRPEQELQPPAQPDPAQPDPAQPDPVREPAPPRWVGPRAEVRIASGISLGGGRIVTFLNAPAGTDLRVTLPGGDSQEARLRVVDRHSGLSLLKVQVDLPALPLASSKPVPGLQLMTGAAGGMDKPLMSLGVLGGTDRTVGDFLPPLLQCDLRTTSSSCGAAVLDFTGHLQGVIVATAAPAERTGWTYAVPVSHVRRLLSAMPEDQVPGVVVLRRRRPQLGLVLEGEQPGVVLVQRVIPGGPAEQSGIHPGERVLALDGYPIRSVYQVVVPVLRKQPGDRVSLKLSRGEHVRQIQITLGNAGPTRPVDFDVNPELGLSTNGRSVAHTLPTQQVARQASNSRFGPNSNTGEINARTSLAERSQTLGAEQLQLLQQTILALHQNHKQQQIMIGQLQEQIRTQQETIQQLQTELHHLNNRVQDNPTQNEPVPNKALPREYTPSWKIRQPAR